MHLKIYCAHQQCCCVLISFCVTMDNVLTCRCGTWICGSELGWPQSPSRCSSSTMILLIVRLRSCCILVEAVVQLLSDAAHRSGAVACCCCPRV